MEAVKSITSEIVEEAWTYSKYAEVTQRLFEQGRTTNEDNTDSMLNYTRLSMQRMKRLDRKAVISDSLISELQGIQKPMIWLTLTEGWCGDASQILPFLNKMAEVSDHISLRLLLRDRHPDIMDEFLTEGSRSIPKLIMLDAETLSVLGTWGPRPKVFQNLYMEMRADPEIDNADAAKELHLRYSRDKGAEIQNEIAELLKSLK